MTLHTALNLLATICFGLAAFNVPSRGMSLGWCGVFFVALTWWLR